MGDFVGQAYTVAKTNFIVTEDSDNINDDIGAAIAPSVAGIMIGDGVDRSRQMEIFNTLLACANALQDAGMEATNAAQEASVAYGPPGGGRSTIVINNNTNSFPDGNVAVILGRDFVESPRPAGVMSALMQRHVRQAAELWLERIGKDLASE